MGSVERSKKKVQLWKKAIVHFMLCFVMGFFTGFAPAGKSSIFSGSRVSVSNRSDFSPQPLEAIHQTNKLQSFNRSLLDGSSAAAAVPDATSKSDQDQYSDSHAVSKEEEENKGARKLVIIVTPTSMKDRRRGLKLRRLAHTLRLVAPPLLWVVVEQQSDSDDQASDILRKTGIMYRHLIFKENFTDTQAEMDHQRNVALNHIEHHRLSGIVHFAGLSNVYDLSFFDEIRTIEAFGTWPMAFLAANRKKVITEGPVCDSSSEVMGWHLHKSNNLTDMMMKPAIHVSGFAFNSSILWDPERWGRTSSAQHTSQDSLKFVKKEVLEEETQLKGIPSDGCSKIFLWNLDISYSKIKKDGY